MARSDLLLSLVNAAFAGDRSLLRSTTEAIIAEERGKQHTVLADRLAQALNGSANGQGGSSMNGNPDRGARVRDLVVELMPKRQLGELRLTPECLLSCQQLIEEQQRASLLRANGLEPRHRLLLVGPPGNGKTTLAEALAYALSYPFLVVRYDAIIGSYLGETAARLKRVIEFARTTPCVLFFDEFDAIGKERGDLHETGEIKRVVTSLLMQVDDLPSYTVVVAATNHSELLDRAVWRRFQFRLMLPAPSPSDLAVYFDTTFGSLGMKVLVGKALVKRLGPLSYAEAREFCLDVQRRVLLDQGQKPIPTIVDEQLQLWKGRAAVAPPEEKGHRNARTASTKTPKPRRR